MIGLTKREKKKIHGKCLLFPAFPEVRSVWSALQEVLVRRRVGGGVGRESL